MAQENDPSFPDRLTRLREAQAENKRKRDAQASCPHERDEVEQVRIFKNGTRHVYRGCFDCGRPVDGGTWLAKPTNQDLPIGLDDRFQGPPCVRCGAFGTELHHFAPRGIFGKEEAELWPQAWLCPPCHGFWHQMMKGAG